MLHGIGGNVLFWSRSYDKQRAAHGRLSPHAYARAIQRENPNGNTPRTPRRKSPWGTPRRKSPWGASRRKSPQGTLDRSGFLPRRRTDRDRAGSHSRQHAVASDVARIRVVRRG